jgi:hypothetical protein
MPHVVSYELFKLLLPNRLEVGVINVLYLTHETVNILYKNIVTGDQHSFLLLLASCKDCPCCVSSSL